MTELRKVGITVLVVLGILGFAVGLTEGLKGLLGWDIASAIGIFTPLAVVGVVLAVMGRGEP